MNNEIIKELAMSQEKLRAINTLSNCMQKLSAKEGKEIAYLIHQIVEAKEYHTGLAREVTGWGLQANKDLFISVVA